MQTSTAHHYALLHSALLKTLGRQYVQCECMHVQVFFLVVYTGVMPGKHVDRFLLQAVRMLVYHLRENQLSLIRIVAPPS